MVSSYRAMQQELAAAYGERDKLQTEYDALKKEHDHLDNAFAEIMGICDKAIKAFGKEKAEHEALMRMHKAFVEYTELRNDLDKSKLS